MEKKKKTTGNLKNYKASLQLKENVPPSHYEARKLPLLPLVVVKLPKLIEQGLLEYVPPGGSKWVSPIVVLKSHLETYVYVEIIK